MSGRFRWLSGYCRAVSGSPYAFRRFATTVRAGLAQARDLGDQLMERRYGIRSRGEVILPEHREDSSRLDYKPTPWATLPRALRRSEVGPEDVFVDFGAGKGRVVFLAARYPFRRVVGVELSPELSAVARANVRRNLARLRCRDVQIVTSDVLDFAIPDDLTVAFFFNPFRGEIFASVIERLMASVDRRPRRVRIVYRNPAEHEFLMATGRVRLVRRIRGMRPTAAWSRTNSTNIYELSTARPGGGRA